MRQAAESRLYRGQRCQRDSHKTLQRQRDTDIRQKPFPEADVCADVFKAGEDVHAFGAKTLSNFSEKLSGDDGFNAGAVLRKFSLLGEGLTDVVQAKTGDLVAGEAGLWIGDANSVGVGICGDQKIAPFLMELFESHFKRFLFFRIGRGGREKFPSRGSCFSTNRRWV